jgi:outer membrane protein OmpA-like peptidoglycan-associated protein
MKKNISTIFALIIVLISVDAFSQTYSKRFGIEVNGGLREYHGDLGSALFFARKPDYQAIGVSLNYYINPSFDASLYGSVGDLGFYEDLPFAMEVNGLEYLTRGFRSRITDGLIGLTYKFNNGYILPEDGMFKPYVKGGWGIIQSISDLHHVEDGIPRPIHRTWYAAHWNLGVGVRVTLTDYLDLSLQTLLNYSFDDNYDGMPFTLDQAQLNSARVPGNKPLHDIYMYHSIGFVYSFGDNGRGAAYKFGDEDGDGVTDEYDKCPGTPKGWPVDEEGCPLDEDKDGVPDHLDKCPGTPAGVEVDEDGCPLDSDGDGVPNYLDKCPDTPEGVNVDEDGCPVVTDEERAELDNAAKGVYFEINSSTLKEESYEKLDVLVEFMNSHPGLTIVVEGHTDNTGNPESNKKLSQERVNSVKDYLVSKGIDRSRLKAVGYGQEKPLYDNNTEEGRVKNRRVYFDIQKD